MEYDPPCSPVHENLQASTLEVSISYSRDLPNLRIKTVSIEFPALADTFFTAVPPGKPYVYTYIDIYTYIHNVYITHNVGYLSKKL